MNDALLIKALRSWDGTPFDEDAHEAADRIEQLKRENAEMAAAITDAENNGICSGGNLWRFWSRAAREAAHARAQERSTAEAKLAKAVEVLRWYADFGNHLAPIDLDKGGKAEEVLAEIDKQ
jgi:hypothetical protein